MATLPCKLSSGCLFLLFSLFTTSISVQTGFHNHHIGVNYGTLADNLPPPSEVVSLIQSTAIAKVKLYNTDPSILAAFANSSIQITVGIANIDVLPLTNANNALQWVKINVAAYMPATQIIAIAVGNEVFATKDRMLIEHLVPAMESLHAALVSLKLDSNVKISSPHSLGILHTSFPPSAAIFRPGLTRNVILPMLAFLANTSAPFMANAYPFFGYLGDPNPNPELLNYALFNSSVGYTDPNTSLHYTNMFDAQVDAVYSAMEKLGYRHIQVLVTETGWPSVGDSSEQGASLVNAQTYNNNLIRHILSNQGTPLRPKNQIDVYIFALFNEDLKPGPTSERNYGLFQPDMSPVYSTAVSKLLVHNRSLPNLIYGGSPSPSPVLILPTGVASSMVQPALLLPIFSAVAYFLFLLLLVQHPSSCTQVGELGIDAAQFLNNFNYASCAENGTDCNFCAGWASSDQDNQTSFGASASISKLPTEYNILA